MAPTYIGPPLKLVLIQMTRGKWLWYVQVAEKPFTTENAEYSGSAESIRKCIRDAKKCAPKGSITYVYMNRHALEGES